MPIGTTNYPSALDTASTLFEANNRGSSTLSATLAAGATASMTVVNAAAFAASGAVTIEDEIIYYSGRDTGANTLTGLSRGQQGTADVEHLSTRVVEQRITARHLSVLQDAILALESKLGIGADAAASGDFFKGTGASASAWSALSSAEIATALGYTPLGLTAANLLSGSGSVRGPLYDRGGFYFHVGPAAVGDDATDNTAVIQAAIDEANSAGGGTVVFGDGTYRSNKLTLYSNVRLAGQGPRTTILKLNNARNEALVQTLNFTTLTGTTALGTSGWALVDLTLDGNKANQTVVAPVLQTYGHDYRLENVNVRNGKGQGWYSEWSDPGATNALGAMESVIRRCKFHTNDSHGVENRGPHDSLFDGCFFYDNGGRGYWGAAGSDGNSLHACHAWGNAQTYCYYVERQHNLEGCIGEGAQTSQVMLGANTCIVSGCFLYAAGTMSTPVGIEIGDASHTNIGGSKITGTLITSMTSGAIKFGSGEGDSDIEVKVYQASGSVFSGTPNTNSRVFLTYAGGGTGPSYAFSLPSGHTARLRAVEARGSLSVGQDESAQFPVQMSIVETTHVTSARAAFNLASWQVGNDPDGNGATVFYIYGGNPTGAQRLTIADTGVVRVHTGLRLGASSTAGQFARASSTDGTIVLEVVPFSVPVTLLSPTTGTTVMAWRAPFACTVTNVRAHFKGGTSVVINARRNQASNHLASNFTQSTADAWGDGGTVQNTAYAAGDDLEVMFVTVNGAVTEATIQVDFTRP